MVAAQIAPAPPEDLKYLTWRRAVADELWYAGYQAEARAFYYCRDEEHFRGMAVCSADISHFATPLLDSCKHRFCSECERVAQAKRFDRFMPAIETACNFGSKHFSLKLITLTTPHSLYDDDIAAKIRSNWNAVIRVLEKTLFAMYKSKATKAERRRGRISMKRIGMGAIASMEFGERGKKLHFHILFYGCFIPQALLADEWKAATDNQAQVVDIRAVHGSQDGAREVILKYITKFTELPPKAVVILMKAIKGVRRIRAYGIFHGIPGDEKDSPVECPECQSPVRYIHIIDFEIEMADRRANLIQNSGNKSGEKSRLKHERNGRDPTGQPTNQGFLPGLDTKSMPEKKRNNQWYY